MSHRCQKKQRLSVKGHVTSQRRNLVARYIAVHPRLSLNCDHDTALRLLSMALLSEEMDSDLLRLWGLVAELSEQLNANRAMTAALQSQAAQAKVNSFD